MRARVRWATAVVLMAASACGGDPHPAAPMPAPAAFVRVDIVVPTTSSLSARGETLQLRAVASFDDGSTVYRHRAGDTNLAVSPELAPGFEVVGVVVDAATRAPVVGARVRRDDQDPGVVTDGNGFFTCRTRTGPRWLIVSKVGYADGVVDLSGQVMPPRVDVSLAPNPGAYIERTVEGQLASVGSGLPQATQRIVMIAGGVLDAEVFGIDCDDSPTLTIEARSADNLFPGHELPNARYARVRLVAPLSEVVLTIRGNKVPRYRLTWREPR